MNPSLAFVIGFIVGVVAVALAWARNSDSHLIESAHREDAAYDRGYRDAKTGKAPESKKLIINTTL